MKNVVKRPYHKTLCQKRWHMVSGKNMGMTIKNAIVTAVVAHFFSFYEILPFDPSNLKKQIANFKPKFTPEAYNKNPHKWGFLF